MISLSTQLNRLLVVCLIIQLADGTLRFRRLVIMAHVCNLPAEGWMDNTTYRLTSS